MEVSDMTPITKTTYVDNWDSKLPNTVEIGIGNKKAFIEHKTGKLINNDGIKNIEKYQAYRLGRKIALEY